jgi:hypothetical protein
MPRKWIRVDRFSEEIARVVDEHDSRRLVSELAAWNSRQAYDANRDPRERIEHFSGQVPQAPELRNRTEISQRILSAVGDEAIVIVDDAQWIQFEDSVRVGTPSHQIWLPIDIANQVQSELLGHLPLPVLVGEQPPTEEPLPASTLTWLSVLLMQDQDKLIQRAINPSGRKVRPSGSSELEDRMYAKAALDAVILVGKRQKPSHSYKISLKPVPRSPLELDKGELLDALVAQLEKRGVDLQRPDRPKGSKRDDPKFKTAKRYMNSILKATANT